MAKLLRAFAFAGALLGEAAGVEAVCEGAQCSAAEDDVSLLARPGPRSRPSRHFSAEQSAVRNNGQGSAGSVGYGEELSFLSQIHQDWDGKQPVMMTAWGGLDGALDEKLFSETIIWDSAKEYFFVKDVSGDCDPNDINKDALCSQIAYVSMMRKDLFNTYFSNDGNYGHIGRPGLVLRPSSWNTEAQDGERVHFKQGWFIDSWPDYRFVSSGTTTEDRFVGLNYKPSGYRTNISLAYLESIGSVAPKPAEEARSVAPPPYLVGNTGGAGDDEAYFSYEAPLSVATVQAFINYYGSEENKTLGAFECFDKEGKRPNSTCNTGANINFFQGFVDFSNAGLQAGLERLAMFRRTYFEKQLYGNSPTGPPFGNEVELDAFPWKTVPEERQPGDSFTAYMLPFSSVGAVTMTHGGPKWTLSTRPQPPHISAQPLAWGVDPEYYYLYKGFKVLFDGIKSSLADGAEPPEQWEVSNIWGTDFAGAELEGHIQAWRDATDGPEASDVFNPWVDFYADVPGPQYVVSTLKLPTFANGGSSYFRVKSVPKKLDARSLAVKAGFGVWASACEKAVHGVTLIASPGDDDLYGGVGDDTLVALGATDRLTGGPGVDTFVVEATSARVIVTDLQVKDVLELEGCHSAAEVSVSTAYWPGVLPPADTAIYRYRGGDSYTTVGLPGRPGLVQLWRVGPEEVEVSKRGARSVCQLTRKAVPPTPPLAP